MARYMLDTDTCSYIMKRSNPAVLRRLSPRRAQDAAALAAFLPYVAVRELPDEVASHYAEIRADLKRRGALIGGNDLLIAAHARSLGLRLVTNNTSEFRRVGGLQVENWAAPARRKG